MLVIRVNIFIRYLKFIFMNRLLNSPAFAGTVVALVVGLLLSVFLVVKVVGEIISWDLPEEYPSSTITVNGKGEVLAVADIASFTFTVSQTEDTVENAQEGATSIINEAIKFLKDNGVSEEDIKTTAYDVYPQYDYNNRIVCITEPCPSSAPRIVGYQVSQTTSVKVRQTDEAGRFLTELGKIGISNVSGLSFTTDDEDIYKDQARDKAIADAKEKAGKLAKQLGVDLEDIVSFGEDQPYGYGSAYGGDQVVRTMESSAKVSPDISLGENSYISNVWITYEID